MYSEAPTACARAMLALCCRLIVPLMQLAQSHTFALSESSSSNSNAHRDLSKKPSLYTHTLIHLPAEVSCLL